MVFDDSPAGGGAGSFLLAPDATTRAASPRIQNLRSVLEATGGVVPSLPWLQQASDAVMAPEAQNYRGGNGNGNEVAMEQVDAVFVQVLHHDLRCVVDRTSPSQAARRLRNEINRSLAANPAAVQGRGGQQIGADSRTYQAEGGDRLSSCRLLVQLEEVVNVALSNEARMQRDVHNDPAANSYSSSLSASGSRCLKLQLVDGYQHPLQPRHNPASNNTQATSLTNSAIVAMEMSPIPNLTDQTMAGTKLLLTLGGGEAVPTTSSSRTALASDSSAPTLRISHGVLMLTPQNCLVVGGHVPELAAEQARQRKALQDQSGASITDPTIRALVSHNYMTDANADDDEGDEREGASGDVANHPARAVARTPTAPPVVTPRTLTSALPRSPGVMASSMGLLSGPQLAATSSRVAGTQPSAPRAGPATGSTYNHYSISLPSQGTTARGAVAPPPAATSSFHAPVPTTNVRAGAVSASGSVRPARATTAVNPYATRPFAATSSAQSQPDHHHQSSDNGTLVASPPSLSVADTLGAGSVGTGTCSLTSPSMATVRTTTTSSLCGAAACTVASTVLSPPLPQMPYDELYELLHSATRQRSAYEQLYRQTVYAKMVQQTPKLHFNIEKIPRERRLDPADDRASQRKHEYVLIARFHAGAQAEQSHGQSRRSITCKLANRILEPFFVHPADELRQMKKADRARVDELVLHGGRKLQNWTVQDQLYRIKLLLNPDEFFAIVPRPALDNNTLPLLTLDTP